ncbi:MAG: hypothetical protein AAF805_00820 [Planctomycetota bacterium]
MANTMRWRYGDTNPVTLESIADDDVEIGDLVGKLDGSARPASAFNNVESFRDAFLGVAMQASPLGQTSGVRVATTGVFEFECDADGYEVGDPLQVAAAGPVGCVDQRIARCTADPQLVAIGRCAKNERASQTRVLIDVISVVMKGGPQFATAQ